MTKPDAKLLQELAADESYLQRIKDHAARVEGARDRLILALADNSGCHQGRPTAVR